MKMYRPVIRDTNYSEEYRTFDKLFKTKKSLKLWFELWKDECDVSNMLRSHLKGRHQNRFPYVLVGIEEVNVK